MNTHPYRLRLYATAIALQQMHGQAFAQAFLQEQGVDTEEADLLTTWVRQMFCQKTTPSFEQDFTRALFLLRTWWPSSQPT